MIRLLIILAAFAPLLPGVSPEFDKRIQHNLELEKAAVRAHVSKPDGEPQCEVTVRFTIFNRGDEFDDIEQLDFDLVLPASAIPANQHKTFQLNSEDTELPPTTLVDGQFRCPVSLADNQRITVSWSWSATLTRLPQEHPLGRRMFRVPLQHVKEFVKLPERLDAQVSYEGLPDELFGRDAPLNGGTIDAGVDVEGKFENFEYRFLSGTLASKRSELLKRLEGFTESQRNADNRSYTETLVLLSELHDLAGDAEACAGICETLARLEAESGQLISHCGPWAQWRRYVPWALKRVAADKAAGNKVDAAAAKQAVQARWQAYLEARDKRRPFDHFDAVKFGSYWDYDWDRTRELYAQVLEILGEDEAAADVRETGESDE